MPCFCIQILSQSNKRQTASEGCLSVLTKNLNSNLPLSSLVFRYFDPFQLAIPIKMDQLNITNFLTILNFSDFFRLVARKPGNFRHPVWQETFLAVPVPSRKLPAGNRPRTSENFLPESGKETGPDDTPTFFP